MSEFDLKRREFLRAAGLSAATIAGAPAILAQRNPNDTLRLAIVGVGTRGYYLMQLAQQCPNTEIRVISDLYQGNIERAKKACTNPGVRIEKEWEKAVSASDVDAVIIATPDFWHAPMAIRAAESKKDVYVEKGLCKTLEEAKGIRKAVKDNHVILQLGHHQNGDPYFLKAREIVQSGRLGKIALARTYIDRTNPWPEWKFYTAYNIQEVPKDAGPATIDWDRFVANAPKRPFDVERFFLWRKWWDYGTGIAGDLMSHQWDGVNLILGMGIPDSVVTHGAHYFWKDGRDVPDQWHVMFDYPKQELAVQFNCTFHNRHQGTNTYILGRDASLEVEALWCRLYDAEWKPEYAEKLKQARETARSQGLDPATAEVPPVYSMKPGEVDPANANANLSHMRNWIECIRSRQTPRCGIDRAWEEAVTIVMSVDSYRKERKVKWDPVNEEVI
jgi:predicted dehydrogenase